MPKVKKIDEACIKAIEDLQGKIRRGFKEEMGYERTVHFTEASKVLGMKYFQRNFGKIPMDDVMRILKRRRSK